MQTFLPYQNFIKSARVLDNKRLGKQRVEVKQLLNALSGQKKGWSNHPAALAWRGYESALALYGLRMCDEWIARGFKDTTQTFMVTALRNAAGAVNMPPWLGDELFHSAHRSNLLRKDPVHYGQFGWTEPDNLPYKWPTLTDYGYVLIDGKPPEPKA